MKIKGYIETDDKVTIILKDGTLLPYFSKQDKIIKYLRRDKDNRRIMKVIQKIYEFEKKYANYIDDEFLFKAFLQALKDLDMYIFRKLSKFIERLKENPSSYVRKNLYKFLSNHSIIITSDGYIIGYKAVRSNYYDIFSGKIKYEPGKTISMKREDVDGDPKNLCSSGLHVGTLEYAKRFGGSKSKILKVQVDPKDVVVVPDLQFDKMRVCKMKVISEYKEFPKVLRSVKGEYILSNKPIKFHFKRSDSRVYKKLGVNNVFRSYYLYDKKKERVGILVITNDFEYIYYKFKKYKNP